MKAVLVFFVILAVALPTGACVASGGSQGTGRDATDLISGDRPVAVSNGTESLGSNSSRLIMEAAKRDDFLPILVNTPGIHGFAPQKSQEPDATIVSVSRPYAHGLRLLPNGLEGTAATQKGYSHP